VLIASWNVLADGYVKPERYPFTPPAWLATPERRRAVLRRIATPGIDVLCLQEVEADLFASIRRPGYYARKGCLKPDGVATFTRGPVSAVETLRFTDNTGHVALLTRVGHIGVANVHIKHREPGPRQARELLDALRRLPCDAWVVCGDFNAEPDSEVVAEFRARGFVDAYAACAGPTCNSDRVPKRIDYVFHSPALRSAPEPLVSIAADTPLPSETEPSDHLMIGARFA
jgi:endonuclease/exonuclease/phosphatase family metal-dependent hydrolase